jgi:hypothetical protein
MTDEAAAVEQYIARLPDDRAAAVRNVRDAVVQESPAVVATMDHGMPFYTLDDRPYIAVASQKHHVSVDVVGLDELLAGRPELAVSFAGIDRGRNCLRYSKTRLPRLTTEAMTPLVQAACRSRGGLRRSLSGPRRACRSGRGGGGSAPTPGRSRGSTRGR